MVVDKSQTTSFLSKFTNDEVAEKLIELGVQTRNADGSFKTAEDILNQINKLNERLKEVCKKLKEE